MYSVDLCTEILINVLCSITLVKFSMYSMNILSLNSSHIISHSSESIYKLLTSKKKKREIHALRRVAIKTYEYCIIKVSAQPLQMSRDLTSHCGGEPVCLHAALPSWPGECPPHKTDSDTSHTRRRARRVWQCMFDCTVCEVVCETSARGEKEKVK